MGEVVQDWCETDYSGEMRSVQSEKEQEQENRRRRGEGRRERGAASIGIRHGFVVHMCPQ